MDNLSIIKYEGSKRKYLVYKGEKLSEAVVIFIKDNEFQPVNTGKFHQLLTMVQSHIVNKKFKIKGAEFRIFTHKFSKAIYITRGSLKGYSIIRNNGNVLIHPPSECLKENALCKEDLPMLMKIVKQLTNS